MLVALLLAPALAAPAADATSAPLGEPGWGVRFDDGLPTGTDAGHDARAVLDPVAAAGDDVSADDLLAAAARLAEAAWGAPVEAIGASASATAQTGFPMGDATGDGVDDVLVSQVDLASGAITLRVHRGLDGEPVWTRAMEASFGLLALPADDLTGDGRDDLVLLSLEPGEAQGAGQCAPAAGCLFGFGTSARWRLLAVSGADGTDAWTRETPLVVADLARFSFHPAGNGATAVGAALTAAVVPAFVDDRDGDGAPELLVHERSILYLAERESLASTASVAAGSFLHVTEAAFVDGASGLATPARASPAAYGESALLPIGDAVGDASPDYVWSTLSLVGPPAAVCAGGPQGPACVPDAGSTAWHLVLELVDGETLLPAWTSERELHASMDSATVAALGGDATGDGRADLTVRETRSFSLTPPRLALVSGADGREAWDASAFRAFALGPIDGGPESDVLLATHVADADGVVATLLRVDGATGATLFATERSVAFGGGFGSIRVDVSLLGDVDGDDAADVLFGTTMSSSSSAASTWTVESGATGDELFADEVAQLAQAYPAGDVDADGVPDLYLIAFEGGFMQGSFTLRAIPLATGLAAWNRTDAPAGEAPEALVLPGGDLSGAPGDDLVYNVKAGFGDATVSEVHVLAGSDGQPLWTLGTA